MTDLSYGQVGLGAVGQHFARHLLGRFGRLTVYDRDRTRMEKLAAEGAHPAASASILGATCDCILLSLPNPAAVMEVLTGAEGLLADPKLDGLVVDCSTIDPGTARDAARACEQRQVRYVEAPVTSAEPGYGGSEGAKAANLTFLVGGEDGAVAAASHLFELLGERHLHLGPVGAGSIMKLVSNHISGVITLAVAEGLVLAAAAGFPVKRTLEVCKHTVADNYVMNSILAPRLESGDYDPGFSVDLMLKDHRLAGALGRELDVPLLFNQLAAEVFQMMRAQGLGGRDHALCAEYLAELASVDLASGAKLP